MTTPDRHEHLRFGPFEMDRAAGELRRDGVPVRLQDLPLRILEMLLEKPGVVVGRDALQERLWDPGTHLDFDNSLNAAVSKLRDALGDSADRPRYVATVPRRGYRFVAPVAGLSTEPVPASGGASPPRPVRTIRDRVVVAGGIAVALLLTLFLVETVLDRASRPAPGTMAAPRRVAVLPLEDLSPTPDVYFADGLTEEITGALARLAPGRLEVIGRTSVRRYREEVPTARELGDDLGVGHVLSGSVRRQGPDLRISVELVDTATQTQAWSASYDRRLDAVFAVQDDIARQVAAALAVTLLPSRRRPPKESRTTSTAAIEAQLEGRFLLQRRTRDAMERAVLLFEEALRLDPDWNAPRLGLASAYLLLGVHDYRRPHDALPQARLAAYRALQIEPESAGAHLVMAVIKMSYDWDWDGAEDGFRRALALAPDSVDAHDAYAGFLASRGRFDEALAAIRQARVLDPLSMTVRAEHGWILFFARRLDEAEAVLQEAVALDPNHLPCRDNLKWLHATMNRPAAAFADLLEVIRLEGATPADVEDFRRRFEPLEWPEVVRGIIAGMETRAAERYQSPYDIALEYAQLGEVEPALDWLERSVDEREADLVSIEVDPRLDTLRQDPRFAALVERVAASATPSDL